jgi:Amt family ammonium transporter
VAAHYARTKKVSVIGIGLGGIAGLVCITPAAGFVSPMSAIVMGLVAGPVCFLAVEGLKGWMDDTLDVFGVHGVGGILGALLTGLLATGQGGLSQLGVQAVAVGVVGLYSAVATWGILKLLELTVGLRVSSSAEKAGLDVSQHGEVAYRL